MFWLLTGIPPDLSKHFDEFFPSALGDFITEVDRLTGRKSGKPDIMAWQDDSIAKVVFIECKGPGDKIHQRQEQWLKAALCEGISFEQFAVARWSMG